MNNESPDDQTDTEFTMLPSPSPFPIENVNQRLGVFWDLENCPPPNGMPGFVVVENIRKALHHFGNITMFKAYLEINENSHKKGLRSELQSSGVSLTDCPHNGRKDSVDKMILVDMLGYAIDNPCPACVCLISGDRDFVYALSILRNRKYTVILIVPNKGAPVILRSQASAILEWKYDVLKFDAWKDRMNNIPSSPSPPNKPSYPMNQDTLSGVDKYLNLESSGIKRSTSMPFIGAANRTQSSPKQPRSQSPLRKSQEANKTIGFFEVLIETLLQFKMAGDDRPLRSKVGHALLLRNPLIYQRAGVSSFKDYSELALSENIIELGGEKAGAWIALANEFSQLDTEIDD